MGKVIATLLMMAAAFCIHAAAVRIHPANPLVSKRAQDTDHRVQVLLGWVAIAASFAAGSIY